MELYLELLKHKDLNMCFMYHRSILEHKYVLYEGIHVTIL